MNHHWKHTDNFKDGNTNPALDDYAYDLNGNMIKDRNKGITNIVYNHLNLPVEIIWSSTKKIEYIYNAAGVKMRKKVTNGTNIKTTDYLDGFQYSQELLEFFSHGEGYVKATAQSESPVDPQYAFNYVFNYTDHLGNVRVSYTKDPQTGNLKILDESHYYPFGLKHQEYQASSFTTNPIQGVIIAPVVNNPYKYKYNGKEFQDELNLNMYDMDMRQYDPAIARWVVLDPVIHHSLSPYNAFDNNPVFWADPSGADSEFFSAFADQNIDHYGTSNTIDIANIIEANQKMENTMQMIKALIKLAENYGGKNSKSGGKPENGGLDKQNVDSNNQKKEDGIFDAIVEIDKSVPKDMFKDIKVIREDPVPGEERTFNPDKHGEIEKVDGVFLRNQPKGKSWFKISDYSKATIYYSSDKGLYIKDATASYNPVRLSSSYYVDWVDKETGPTPPTVNPFDKK